MERNKHMPGTRAPIRIDILRRMIRTGAHSRARNIIESTPAADIAELFPSLSKGEQRTLINLLFESNRAGKTLKELPHEFLPEVLDLIDDQKLATILTRVGPDDAAYFIESLPEERRAPLLKRLEPAKRLPIERVLGSPEESAGAFMTTEVATVPQDSTCQEALDRVRKAGDRWEVFYIYAVDSEGRLTGVVPIRSLITSPPDRKIGEVMIPDPVSVRVDADQEEAANLVAKYNLMALPVVDEDHKLMGAITVDDVIEVIQEEATEDMYRMVGLEWEDRIFSPLGQSLRKRLPWMMLNLVTAFLAASVVGLFQHSIETVVVLAVFMPVVAGMGGNVGTQTLTVVTRGLALGEIELTTVAGAVVKQMGVGVGIGAATGILTAGAAFLWHGSPFLGLVLFLAMLLNLALAGLAGALVPLILHRFKLDPAMGSGVIVTTVTDVGGFFAFLGLATLFIDKLA